MMAAADLSRLVLIFSLLCLVGFASALIDKSDLERLKESHEKARHHLDNLKAEFKSEMDDTSEVITKQIRFLEALAEQHKEAEEGLPDDFPSTAVFLENAKVQVEKLKAYNEKTKEKLCRQIDDFEKNLEKKAKLIKFLEEQRDEL